MHTWIQLSKTALLLFLTLSLVTGVLYPALVTGSAQFFFPWQANGALITRQDKTIGSLHIGQSFTDEKYFWGRPSATTPTPYHGASSSASNWDPSHPLYLAAVKKRIHALRASDPQHRDKVPNDLVTASGSGLDPEISPHAAYYQIPRIAKARGLTEKSLQKLVLAHTQFRTLGGLGEPRVHVLNLNIALDEQQNHQERS